MSRRSSKPREEPPREQGGRRAWLTGVPPAVAGVALLAMVLVVLLVVLLT